MTSGRSTDALDFYRLLKQCKVAHPYKGRVIESRRAAKLGLVAAPESMAKSLQVSVRLPELFAPGRNKKFPRISIASMYKYSICLVKGQRKQTNFLLLFEPPNTGNGKGTSDNDENY